MKELAAVALMLSVALVTTTVLAFSGVYFTTLIVAVLFAELVTYFTTHWVFNQLKKTDC